MWWKRKKQQPRTLTGVKTVLSAAHRDQTTGRIHGHTWEIVAWFEYEAGTDQKVYRDALNRIVMQYDHTCLPDHIAWGEALAEHVCRWINASAYSTAWCVAVDVIRPSEGIYARFEA